MQPEEKVTNIGHKLAFKINISKLGFTTKPCPLRTYQTKAATQLKLTFPLPEVNSL